MDYKVGERPALDLTYDQPKFLLKHYEQHLQGKCYDEKEVEELVQVVSGILAALITIAKPDLEQRKELNSFIASHIESQFEILEKERQTTKERISQLFSTSTPRKSDFKAIKTHE